MIHDGFIVQNLIRLFSGIGEDHCFGIGVDDPIGQLMSGESSEDDDVSGADSRACQEGNNALNNHGHIDNDTIPDSNSKLRLQSASKCLYPTMQLSVSDG
jgi:hypothetical protein